MLLSGHEVCLVLFQFFSFLLIVHQIKLCHPCSANVLYSDAVLVRLSRRNLPSVDGSSVWLILHPWLLINFLELLTPQFQVLCSLFSK